MKPIHEYLSLPIEEFHRDTLELSTTAERRAAWDEYKRLKPAPSNLRGRIEKFLKTHGPCTRVQLSKGLNIRKGRVEAADAVKVLQQLINENLIEWRAGDSSSKGGRRGIVVSWIQKRAPLTPAELDAIAQKAIDAQLLIGPITDAPPPTPKISLDKPEPVCEDVQVAEFRKGLISESKTNPVSEPKAQKIKRSALMEGLGS